MRWAGMTCDLRHSSHESEGGDDPSDLDLLVEFDPAAQISLV
jgi:predicted nucleotidyltransferase